MLLSVEDMLNTFLNTSFWPSNATSRLYSTSSTVRQSFALLRERIEKKLATLRRAEIVLSTLTDVMPSTAHVFEFRSSWAELGLADVFSDFAKLQKTRPSVTINGSMSASAAALSCGAATSAVGASSSEVVEELVRNFGSSLFDGPMDGMTGPVFGPHLLDTVTFLVYCTSASLCLGFSAAYHLFFVRNPKWFSILQRLDYAGIAVLIGGSAILAIRYGFYCHPFLQYLYYSLVSVICTVGLIISVGLSSTWVTHAMRAGSFVIMGACAGLPVIHMFFLRQQPDFPILGGSIILLSFLYVLGAVLYATKVPERFYPGRFDCWFQSHQLFHILVVLAATIMYFGCRHSLLYRLENPGNCFADF
jgi:channel protein (hemolysin III family)